jgi:hypothetical protein
MPYLKQLADVARRTGFPVTECGGWRTRGHGAQPEVRGIVAHHTAGRNDLHVVRDGRPGLPGPLSHFWLQHTGRIWVVAAGKCYHNAPSTSAMHDNGSSIGIEAENDGYERWPDVQVDAFKALSAALCAEFGLSASRVMGHKEVQRGKPDPHGINMTGFRADVARLMEGDDVDIDAVWHDARIKLNKGDKDESSVSPAAYLQRLETEQDAIKAQLRMVLAKLDALGR